MYKLKAKNLKTSPLTSRQETQLEIELRFAEKNREFLTKQGAEAFASNLPQALYECVEVVESK